MENPAEYIHNGIYAQTNGQTDAHARLSNNDQ